MAKEVKKENNEAAVIEAVSKTDLFFKENEKTIIAVVVAAVVIAFGIYAYQKWVFQPKAKQAQEQLFPAEFAFGEQNWETALNGDGNNLGFAQVIEEYKGATPKVAWLDAGVCALQLGEYETALSYLKKYNGKDAIMKARALACQGDAQVGLENYSAALACYQKAAAVVENMYAAAYLLKAGVCAEELGKNDVALKCYETIKQKYPQSMEGYDIDKYINRIK